MSPPAVERALCDAVIVGRVDGADPAHRQATRVMASDTAATCDESLLGQQAAGSRREQTAGSRASVEDLMAEGADSISVLASATSVQVPASAQRTSRSSSGRAIARAALAAAADAAEARPKRTIPAKVRREVDRRDHRRCQVPGCRSAFNVDHHHIKHWILGGTHTVDNLISLCELCRARHNTHYADYAIMPRRPAGPDEDRVLYAA
jgi:hypothetical protein